MASGPITSWPIDGETVADFIFLGSKITADGDCSHEIKRRLLLGRKVMTNLDSILKSRSITSPTKVRLVKAMVFPVVMYGCESWTIKKAECQRIYAFELWCWRRLLRVPWTASRSNQSILKENNPEYSLEGRMLKPKLQYFGHLMRRTDSLEKILMLGNAFVGKVMSLLLNMLSMLVITFLPRSKRLLISWLQSPSAVILEPRKIKSATVSPSIGHEVMGPDAMILVF